MNVLVTGATGFLGGWVTRALVSAGHSVRALARRPDRFHDAGLPDVVAVKGDISSLDDVDAVMADVDAAIHCAGSVSRSPRDRVNVFRANVQGTYNVLEVAARRNVRVLHTSSIACIEPTLHPRMLTEEAPSTVLPFAFPYVESKLKSEQLALSYAARGSDVIVLNAGSVMGPGDPNFGSTELPLSYIRGQLRMYPRGGMSFCDVRDLADAYVSALERGRRGERYILAGVNLSYCEIQEELQRLTGLHRCIPLPVGLAEWIAVWSEIGAIFWRHPLENVNLAVVRWGSLFHYCSSGKAERELGYKNRSFSDTLADTIADQLRRGAAQATTPKLRKLLRRRV